MRSKTISANKNFTIINNKGLQDPNLGIASRGLLATMLSKPDDWNFSIKRLAKELKDGERKISTALKELEQNKYLVRKRICDRQGKVTDWLYLFSDEPLSDEILKQNFRQINYENEPESSEEQNVFQQQKEPHLQNVDVDKQRKKPHRRFADVDNADLENVDNKKELSYKELSYKILSYDLSINQSQNDKIDEIEKYRNILKTQISYEYLVDDLKEHKISGNLDILDGLIEIMTEVMISEQKTYRISGAERSSNSIKGNIMKLEYEHIVYVLECLYKNTTKIKNIKNYMLTCLCNAPATIGQYYQNEAVTSLYGRKEYCYDLHR